MKKGTYYFSNLAKYHIHTVNAKLQFAVNRSYNNIFKYKIPIFQSKEKKKASLTSTLLKWSSCNFSDISKFPSSGRRRGRGRRRESSRASATGVLTLLANGALSHG